MMGAGAAALPTTPTGKLSDLSVLGSLRSTVDKATRVAAFDALQDQEWTLETGKPNAVPEFGPLATEDGQLYP